MKLILSLMFLVTSAAEARTYLDCPGSGASSQRAALDVFCPRLEGAHLEGCCPPVHKSEPLVCTYYKNSQQQVMNNSSYTMCVEGQNRVVACCESQTMPCADEVIRKDFIPRLINRSNSCCFESCPNAQYWLAPPNPDSRFSPGHLVGNAPPECQQTPPNNCTPGAPACQPSAPCPTVTLNPPAPTGEVPVSPAPPLPPVDPPVVPPPNG